MDSTGFSLSSLIKIGQASILTSKTNTEGKREGKEKLSKKKKRGTSLDISNILSPYFHFLLNASLFHLNCVTSAVSSVTRDSAVSVSFVDGYV